MKVAIIHDAIIEFGGSDRILQTLLKLFSNAHIYTSVVDHDILDHISSSISADRLHYSWLQRYPKMLKRTAILQLLSPLIWKGFKPDGYDIVLSNSSFMLPNRVDIKKSVYIKYINSIPKNLFGLESPKRLQKIIPYSGFLASLYRKTIKSSPFIISNSKYTQKILCKLFKLESEVIYPPVRIPKTLSQKKKPEYFIIVSRLDLIKNIELAVQTCSSLNIPLIIVGQAIDQRYKRFLNSIAGSSIEFLGMKSDEEIAKLYESAIGFIFTAKNEDFGISPVEAMAHGVPVIGHYSGGLKETMISGKTGEFFYKYTVDSLTKVIKNFDYTKYDKTFLHNHAKKFSEERFKTNFKKYIRKVMNSQRNSSGSGR